MSCFSGKMQEYCDVSLDRFDGINLFSKIFVLSHCHQDHMVGLGCDQFYKYLCNNKYNLWCHPITKVFLLADSRYRRLEPYITTLEVNNTVAITIPGASEQSISMTFLSAGHCPGSVMCLIEGTEGTVLYTGDIRLSVNDLKNMRHLSGESEKPIPIRSMYFDSTFCVPEAVTIPDRHQSLQATVELVEQWITKSTKHKVLLYCAARYGHEFLMVGLCKKLGLKAHVTKEKLQIYKQIADIKDWVTLEHDTQIHCCAFWEGTDESLGRRGKKFRRIPSCGYCNSNDRNVLLIKPSVMYFTQSLSVDHVAFYDRRNDFYRILYSCHSSMTELRDIIAYLKPQSAFPNVQPMKSTMQQVERRIRDLIMQINEPNTGNVTECRKRSNPESFSICCAKERKIVSLKSRYEFLAGLKTEDQATSHGATASSTEHLKSSLITDHARSVEDEPFNREPKLSEVFEDTILDTFPEFIDEIEENCVVNAKRHCMKEDANEIDSLSFVESDCKDSIAQEVIVLD